MYLVYNHKLMIILTDHFDLIRSLPISGDISSRPGTGVKTLNVRNEPNRTLQLISPVFGKAT